MVEKKHSFAYKTYAANALADDRVGCVNEASGSKLDLEKRLEHQRHLSLALF